MSPEGLHDNPVDIYVTTGTTTYALVVAGATVGVTSGNPTSWSGSYNRYTAPTASGFRLKLVARDAIGNTSNVLSSYLNAGKWSVFAGNSDNGDGATALQARFTVSQPNNVQSSVVATTTGDMFVVETNRIRKITAQTGCYLTN